MNNIETRRLSYGYHSDPVVNEIDFSVRKGEWLGIVGPNRIGKINGAAAAVQVGQASRWPSAVWTNPILQP